jgi:hypothetical protein
VSKFKEYYKKFYNDQVISDFFSGVKCIINSQRKRGLNLIERSFFHLYQRVVYGFDDSETWSLMDGIAKYSLPRLKRFREIHGGTPVNLTKEKWNFILDEIIWMMEIYSSDDSTWSLYNDDFEIRKNNLRRLRRAERYFAYYFGHLWW